MVAKHMYDCGNRGFQVFFHVARKSHRGRSIVTAARTNRGQKRKELFHAVGRLRAVHRRRCLHGLCHGFQWPWLTSGMQAASPGIARARRALNHLHPLVSSGGANNSHCFLCVHSSSWPCPRYSEQLAARSHRLCVRPAPQIFKGKPMASCGRAKRLQLIRLVEAPTRDGGV